MIFVMVMMMMTIN